jgi:ligand-binding SRPBCC domain-containing protein
VPVLKFESEIAAPVEALWAFHASPSALINLTPPERKLRARAPEVPGGQPSEGPTPLIDGALHILEFKLGPLSSQWRARISNVRRPNGFVDTAEQSPFRRWIHRHVFQTTENGCRLIDEVEFELPLAPLSNLALPFVVRDLRKLFAFRHEVTRKALERQR